MFVKCEKEIYLNMKSFFADLKTVCNKFCVHIQQKIKNYVTDNKLK